MEKTIYRIRGNVFFKLGIYILIAALAFGTLCAGALVVEGVYIGQLSNDPRNEAYKRLVNDYAHNNCVNMTDEADGYLENVWNDMKASGNYKELQQFDSNGDGILNSEDLVRGCSDTGIIRKIKDTQSYKMINSREDSGYELSVTNGSETSKGQTSRSVKLGRSSLINNNSLDSGDIEKYTYDNGLELRTYKYLTFDTMQEMTSVKSEIMSAVNSEYEYSDETEYDDYYEDTATDGTGASDDQSKAAASYMYKGNAPATVDVLYMDGAYEGGTAVPNGYGLLLGYDDYSYVNLSGALYVDIEKAIDNTKSESPELAANIGKWVNYFKSILAAFVALAVMCIICTVVSMVNAGVKSGTEGIRLAKAERAPTELVVALAACAVIAGAAICVESGLMSMNTAEIAKECSFVTDNITLYIVVFPVACLYAAAVFLLNNLIAKGKAGVLLRDSIIFRAVRWLGKKLGDRYSYVKGHLSLTAKGVVIYAAITAVEIMLLIVFAASSTRGGMWVLLYIIIKWLCIVGIVAYMIQTQELYKCAKEMAEGNLNRKADISKMFWVFKAHGEHLNQIREGMSKAVDERMKSEHLKTELITNVSHDIKTPLTSIINYVDLLQNKDLDENSRQEYIAVLARQSARLKKLIEDLVEASKASTGNIQINWTEIDANMLLEQAVAEYTDKLAQAGLKVVFTKSNKPAVIMADGQHLWRVFDNLLANISKYSMPGTRVYASVAGDGDRVRIEFKNISREALNVSSDELMERFVRGDSSRNTDGSGLGLSIANSLCSLMKADFELSIDGDLFKAVIIFDDRDAHNNGIDGIPPVD